MKFFKRTSLYASPTIVLSVSNETEYKTQVVFVTILNVLTLSTKRHLSPKTSPFPNVLINFPWEVQSISPSLIIYKQDPGSPSNFKK